MAKREIKFIPVLQNATWSITYDDIPGFFKWNEETQKNEFSQERMDDFVTKYMLKGNTFEEVSNKTSTVNSKVLNTQTIGVEVSLTNLPDLPEYEDFDLERMSYINYAIVEFHDKDKGGNPILRKGYYFITNSTMRSDDKVYFELLEDTFMTWYHELEFADNNTFEIIQGHFDRLRDSNFIPNKAKSLKQELVDKSFVFDYTDNKWNSVEIGDPSVVLNFGNEPDGDSWLGGEGIEGRMFVLAAVVGDRYVREVNPNNLTEVYASSPNLANQGFGTVGGIAVRFGEIFITRTLTNGGTQSIYVYDFEFNLLRIVETEADHYGVFSLTFSADGRIFGTYALDSGINNYVVAEFEETSPTKFTVINSKPVSEYDFPMRPINSLTDIFGELTYNNYATPEEPFQHVVIDRDTLEFVEAKPVFEGVGINASIGIFRSQLQSGIILSDIDLINSTSSSIEVEVEFINEYSTEISENYLSITNEEGVELERVEILEGVNTYLFEGLEPYEKYDFEAKISWNEGGSSIVRNNSFYTNTIGGWWERDYNDNNQNLTPMIQNSGDMVDVKHIDYTHEYDSYLWGERVNYDALNQKRWVVIMMTVEDAGDELTTIIPKKGVDKAVIGVEYSLLPMSDIKIVTPLGNANWSFNDWMKENYNNPRLIGVKIFNANMFSNFNPNDNGFNNITYNYETNETEIILDVEFGETVFGGSFSKENDEVFFQMKEWNISRQEAFNTYKVQAERDVFTQLSVLNPRDKRLETNIWTDPSYQFVLQRENAEEWIIRPQTVNNDYDNWNIIMMPVIDLSINLTDFEMTGGKYTIEKGDTREAKYQIIKQTDWIIGTNDYLSYMYANKNANTQATTKAITGVALGAVALAIPGGAFLSVAGIGGAVNAGLNLWGETSQRADMKDVNSVAGEANNAIYDHFFSEYRDRPILIEQRMRDYEFEKAYNVVYKSGIQVPGLQSNVRLDSRYYFNTWVINGVMNSVDKSDIPNRVVSFFDGIFMRGIRFWHWRETMEDYDDNQYILENLEMSVLEDPNG